VTEIPRGEITDIDHPGNVAAAIGGGIAGYGAVNIAFAADGCDSEGTAFCIGVFTPAVVGVSLLTYGLIIYGSSVSAADSGDMRPGGGRTLTVVPLVLESGELEGGGLSVIGTF